MFITPAYGQESAPAEGAHGGAMMAAEDTHAGTEVPAEGHHEAGFPPFDPTTFASQIFWIAVTFGLFYLFLKRVIMPRIAGILDVRHGRIAADLDQAARMKADADAAVAAYEQDLAKARADANAIANKARDEARAEADAARKTVEAGLEEKLAAAEKRIAAIKDAAMKDVGAIAEETAASIVEQLGAKAGKSEVAAAVKAAAK